MVKVVGPGGVAVPAAALGRAHHDRIVETGLGDHVVARVDGVDAPRHRGDDVLRALVEDGVDRVQAQPVDPEVTHPALGALAHPFAHRVALGVVEVHRPAPWRLVLAGEVGPEGLHGRAARRAEVVVDHVEDHRQSLAMGLGDEGGQLHRAAVGGLGGGDIDAVVTPAPGPGELGHGHDLHRGDAELGQITEALRRGRERALGSEGADVQLVDEQVRQRRGHEAATPSRAQPAGVEHPRWPAQALGLPARSRVGQLRAIDHVHVVAAGGGGDDRLPHAEADVDHGITASARPAHGDRRGRGAGRPHAELGALIVDLTRAQRALPRVGLVGLDLARHRHGASA